MSPAEVLAALTDRGATLALDTEGRVRYHGTAEVLTDDLRRALQTHRLEFPAMLERVAAFRAQARPGQPLPFFRLPGAVGLPAGRCPSCGGDLEPRAYRCPPCGEAARLVADQTRPNQTQWRTPDNERTPHQSQ